MLTEVSIEPWGTSLRYSKPVHRITLRNSALTVVLTDLGARIVSVLAPDRDGNIADIALGYDTAEAYDRDPLFLGAVCGRFCNRIAGGSFELDGERFQIPQNNGPNALHGGPEGFDKQVWNAKAIEGGVELSLISPDGDQGFPGQMEVRVTYRLSGSSLKLNYHATSSEPTVVNLTNHVYFNLTGDMTRNILGHEVQIHASRCTPVDATMIPTGEIASVEGTPLDFRMPRLIGDRIDDGFEQIQLARGYDHNFVLDGAPVAAIAYEPSTGRTVEVSTTQSGVQFYSGNYLDPAVLGKGGVPCARRTGFCLETQHFPDSPNHPHFPTTTLLPGDSFVSATSFTFGTR
ncbi:aldose epimerase family protein [Granulicella cerasi]|uniref:Aldose 1-epimerase n=1 Tax=Granulicella cerasi TaxID=741063 RepID=A0ABW1Z889_9BACT|nr:aldose epimerase family protein [Granulicella cerasi]